MLLYIAAPHLLPDVAPLESQVEVPEESIAAPVAPAASPIETKRPKLSMVWHKEFDGTRECLVARWAVER